LPSNTTLAVSLFFHFCATITWIGGLLITSLLVWPEMRRVLADQPALHALLNRLRARLTPLSNLSLAVLIVTGLIQMSLNPNYDGLLRFDNAWSRVMLLKHGVIVLMALTGLALQYGVIPALERASLRVEKGRGDNSALAEWNALRRREVRLTWLSLALGIAVLGLSAWAGSI
jgi:uncharacterized membrane protein